MKKVLAMAIVAFISYSSYAQESSALFENGTNVVNLGVGLGDVYWGSGYSGVPVSFNASFDRGVTDKLGIGYIGAGGIIGYSARTYKSGGYEWKNSALLIGARATYHFALNGDIAEKLDPYAGVVLGYVITSSSSNTPSGYSYSYGKSSSVGAGAFAGAHYYFSPNFGAFAEVGYNVISILNTGLTVKF
ncbi:MAG TPA: opacity family porin [Puia sp.]|nr:opacity family porin [Puia sp.]